jgi:hypothetical protein
MCNPRSTGHFSLDALASALARSPQKRREGFSAMSDLVQFRPNPKPSQLINATAKLRNANMMFIISRHRRTSCCAHFNQSSASMMGPRGRPAVDGGAAFTGRWTLQRKWGRRWGSAGRSQGLLGKSKEAAWRNNENEYLENLHYCSRLRTSQGVAAKDVIGEWRRRHG